MEKACKIHRLVADVLVRAEGRVLLVRYKDVRRYDGQKGWFLPDDFLNYAEHPREAAGRLLREQAGLQPGDIRLGSIESFGGEGQEAWHLVFHHQVELQAVPGLSPSANIAEAQWFPLNGLPDRAACAHHGWAVDVITEMLKL
jgi:ADP-ribose pyrophosphatase YjhB (NUDIX family)